MRNLIQSNGNIHPCIAFDLEVVGSDRTDEYIDNYKNFKAPSNYKSDTAIQKFIVESKYKERQRAALHIPTQKIWVACIEDVLMKKQEHFTSISEKQIITELFEYLNEFPDHILVGFNSKGYDIPCLFGAALRHNVKIPIQLRHTSLQADILDDFYHNKIKLNDIAFLLNRQKLMSGTDVGQEYMEYIMNGNESSLERIIEYCADDTNIVAEYIRHVYGVENNIGEAL
jgi:DNA polymerase elongation subunit (family B)